MHGDNIDENPDNQSPFVETSKNRAARNICGENVRKRRLQQKLSQQQLAIKCQLLGWDVDRKLISKIEIGIREATDADLRILAAALKVETGAFFEMSTKELKQALDVSSRTRIER